MNDGQRTTDDRLQRQGRTAIFLSIGLWLLAAIGLWQVWPDYWQRWALLSGLMLAYVLALFWRNLPTNHRQGETAVLPTLGLGNSLTLYRGLATALLTGFIFSPWPGGLLAWIPAILYMTADIADYLDGYAARVAHHATRLGEILDMEYDGLSVLIVTLLAVWLGQLPVWYLPLGLARYLFVFGLWLRARRGLPIYDMPPSVHRRIFAGFQMGFLSAVLWPIVPPAGATIAGTVFGAATAVSFLRDWLTAVGWLDPQSAGYKQRQRQVVVATTHWLPLFLRLLLAESLAVVVLAMPSWWPPLEWVELMTAWGLPGVVALADLSLLLLVVGGTAVALGILGRTISFLLVFPVGFDMLTHGLTWANGTALACAAAIMLLGTGVWSLWQPEERWMVKRAGER
ncbi:MAG: CDP-alcohol phosphatidyltransferase family protein [Chloroflexi bacterium]|nr:CDP-alcohol phosphatidyltransferase family protein [Chloroflexota bacterium]MBP7043988.1 CDP-alcohol phosphatidyltransferase family protein [Chloroflexota bacterium]